MVFCAFDHVEEGDLGSDFFFVLVEYCLHKLNFMSIGVFSTYGKILLVLFYSLGVFGDNVVNIKPP
jgi:hypothetical protein